MIIVSGIVTVYYNIIITWVLYFLGNSVTKDLPWASCNNVWNTPLCFDRTQNTSIHDNNITMTTTNSLSVATRMLNASESPLGNLTVAGFNAALNITAKGRTPAEEFWQ